MRASVTLDDDLLKRAHEYTGLTERRNCFAKP